MSSERRAVLLLLGLAVTGQAIRYVVSRPGQAPGDVRIISALPAHSARTHAEAAKAAHRPLAKGEHIDVNRATTQDLTRLPRVGLSLAQRIVAYRDSNGPFRGPDALDRVPGIGPGMIKSLTPHLAFNGTAGQRVSTVGIAEGSRVSGPATSPATPSPRLNVNAASAREIETLPLIGPSRALAIVAWRERHGSFKTLDDLVSVPGVSRRMVDAIRDRIAFH
ncbi:MAG: helix-hairpin-helix domain-containing protein [Gemmatimonadota bacterium]